ncbi:hypothetical protein GCM10027421_17890 [Microbacterium shaanxiense]
MRSRLEAEYILPLRWTADDALPDLTAYLERLSAWVDITVVDGSDDVLFAVHQRAWRRFVRHRPVTMAEGVNGKVRGVLAGVAIARHEAIVIADDDVRYDYDALVAVVEDLANADLVKPQNHFDPLPWHARWDTARSLLNRAVGSDYPGTLGVRRSTITATGGYDADVLFENLELERTVLAFGGRVSNRRDVFVTRRPPTTRHFLSQRVRQAYDSWAQPGRLLLEASIVPAVITLRRRPGALVTLALALICLAEFGRGRDGGRPVFPASSVLWVPVWVAERGVATWIALALRLRGGVRYADGRITRAANSARVLRRRAAAVAVERKTTASPHYSSATTRSPQQQNEHGCAQRRGSR